MLPFEFVIASIRYTGEHPWHIIFATTGQVALYYFVKAAVRNYRSMFGGPDPRHKVYGRPDAN